MSASTASTAIPLNGIKPKPSVAAAVWGTLCARADKVSRWEFWPSAVIYAPLMPYVALLAARHGGLTVCTAVNPAIPMGGVVGESKWSILSRLPADWIIPSEIIRADEPSRRIAALENTMRSRGWAWPIVLKPDVGERGAGVRMIADEHAAAAYLRRTRADVVAQPRHPGPHEAGVFYVREPGRDRGRIFAITEKVFPVAIGDGRSSVRDLILGHPRYRLQAATFLRRLGPRASEVPALGERVPLALAGNHCQGTMFRDGAHLRTRALEDAIDRIAQAAPGYHFGRFDVRYESPEEFAAGRGFQIVEFNGLLSEATNIYDPEWGFWRAQKVLREQWRLAFEIGAANHRAGVPIARIRDVVRAVWRHRKRTFDPGAD